MRYFIGNLIRGEAAEYYKATCADLSARFGIDDVSSIVPPHITVKSGFERPSIGAVDDLIALSTDVAPFPITLKGWNHFDTRTIFVDAAPASPELKEYVQSILKKLQGLGITTSPQDLDVHARMSIARFLKPNQYNLVWKYLESIPAPVFDIKFDNLTLFVKEHREDKAWKILKTFPLIGR